MEPSSDRGAEPVLAEGHYTVALAGAGHRTLEVTRPGPDFGAGPFVVSYLYGPDNESGYRAFGHAPPPVPACSATLPGRLDPRRRRGGRPLDSGKAMAVRALSSMRPAVQSMRRCSDV